MFVESTENTEISAAVSLLKMLNDLSLYCRCDPYESHWKFITHMNQKLLELEELGHLPLKQWAFPSEGVRGCYYQTIAKLQTGSVMQLHGTVYLRLLDEARGVFWPKPASPWLVPAPSLTDPLEATGWALAVLASLVDDLGGCQILEVTYCGTCVVPVGLGDRDYKGVCKWGIS